MTKLKLTPIGGNILVKAVTAEKKSLSGIVIPDTVDKEKPQKGEVIALGTGRMTMDGRKLGFSVKVGDIVIFSKYQPNEVELDGENYLIMEEEAILAIVA